MSNDGAPTLVLHLNDHGMTAITTRRMLQSGNRSAVRRGAISLLRQGSCRPRREGSRSLQQTVISRSSMKFAEPLIWSMGSLIDQIRLTPGPLSLWRCSRPKIGAVRPEAHVVKPQKRLHLLALRRQERGGVGTVATTNASLRQGCRLATAALFSQYTISRPGSNTAATGWMTSPASAYGRSKTSPVHQA